MGRGMAPRRILARKLESLAAGLDRFMVRQPAEKARKLKELARAVLPPPAGLCDTLQANLDHEVSVYAHLDACIHAAEQDIARRLATMPGAMLTTVPGIALTLGSGLFAEIGDPARDRGLGRLVSYAGIVARLKQSGGPDQEARTHGRTRRACVPLKRCVMDIALKMGQYGHPELKADFERRVNAHQDPRLTLGRRMLRICRHLVRHQDFFLPPSVRAAADPDVRRQYVVRAWDKMLIKWRDAGAIREAFAEGAPLEGWRTALNELYGLNLSKTLPYNGQTEIPCTSFGRSARWLAVPCHPDPAARRTSGMARLQNATRPARLYRPRPKPGRLPLESPRRSCPLGRRLHIRMRRVGPDAATTIPAA